MDKLKLCFIFLSCMAIAAQEELHIHHINVENGDATMIGIYNTSLQQRLQVAKILSQVSASYSLELARGLSDL
jgi:hypothetical protein